jgi:hypothetical protein
LILSTYSSRLGHRVAEESTEEALNIAWTELLTAVNVTQFVIFRDVTLRSSYRWADCTDGPQIWNVVFHGT